MAKAACRFCSVGARRVRDVRSLQEHIAIAADVRADAVNQFAPGVLVALARLLQDAASEPVGDAADREAARWLPPTLAAAMIDSDMPPSARDVAARGLGRDWGLKMSPRP